MQLIMFTSYKQGNWIPEKLRKVLEAPQMVNGEAGILIQTYQPRELGFYQLHCPEDQLGEN